MQGSRQSNEHVYTRSQKRNSSCSAPHSVGQEDRRSHPCKMRPCDSAERARVEHALPFSEIEVHHYGALGPTPVTTAPPTSKRSQTRRKPTAKSPTFVKLGHVEHAHSNFDIPAGAGRRMQNNTDLSWILMETSMMGSARRGRPQRTLSSSHRS